MVQARASSISIPTIIVWKFFFSTCQYTEIVPSQLYKNFIIFVKFWTISFNSMYKKNDFLYTQFEHFFWVVATFFDKVARYEFGRLHQNGPETSAQSTRKLASLDHVLFVMLCD